MDYRKQQKRYSGAPYNFIPLSKIIPEVTDTVRKLPAHNEINDNLLSGNITFDIEAATDIFIGGYNKNNGVEQFSKNTYGQSVIPGSTLKGLIRCNMQVLGFSSIAKDVEDYSIMYREVGSRGTKLTRTYADNILGVKQMGKVSLPTNIEAGYITCENGKYYIYSAGEPINAPSFGKMNYYTISEYKMLEDKESFKIDWNKTQYVEKDRLRYDYAPYIEKVLFKPQGKSVSSIVKYESNSVLQGYKIGYLISTGLIQKKKAVYIIPEPSDEIQKILIPIPDKDIIAFRRDYEGRKNSLHGTKCKDENQKRKAREFYELPKENRIKPIFFMKYNGRTYFGFTPYARVFYDKTLYEGIPDEHKIPGKIDYATSILGYSDDESGEAYKSRVSFEDAACINDRGHKSIVLTMGEPKLSSYFDYVKQSDPKGTSYNDDFELRGIKQYWLHEKSDEGKISDKVLKADTVFDAMNVGSRFSAKLHFKNLRPAELGLLLISLYPGNKYQMNIGKAKAYGFGRISVSKPEVSLIDYNKMYSGITMDVFKSVDNIDSYINEYKAEIKEKWNLSLEEESIKDFFSMKDAEHILQNDKIRYMTLEKKEYQNREEALPTVQQVINDKHGQFIENVSRREYKKDGYKQNNKQSQYKHPAGNKADRFEKTYVANATGKTVSAEFIKYDNKRQLIYYKVDGKEYSSKLDSIKALKYVSMKSGEPILVIKQGNSYFLADM